MFRRESPRSRHARTPPTSALRPLVVGVLALFLLLQGLAAIHSSLLRGPRAGEGSVFSALLDATCAGHMQDGRAPTHGGDHAQCCILCGTHAAAGPTPPAAAQFRRAAPSARPMRALWPTADRLDGRPPGWASSWSSQAPPFFS